MSCQLNNKSKFIPIHTYNLTFALGVYESYDAAQLSYINFIKNHKNSKNMEKDYHKQFDTEIIDFADDEKCEFFDKWNIGYDIFEIRNETWEKDVCDLFTTFHGWKTSFYGENHLESIMRALTPDNYIWKDFKMNLSELAIDYPVY